MLKLRIKAFTLLESLLTLAVTSFIIIGLSGGVSGVFREVEERLFFLSFEHLYRDTQKLASTTQTSRTLSISERELSNGQSRLTLPTGISPKESYQVVFDKTGGNSSLSKLIFTTDDGDVAYQLYLGSGNYKKAKY